MSSYRNRTDYWERERESFFRNIILLFDINIIVFAAPPFPYYSWIITSPWKNDSFAESVNYVNCVTNYCRKKKKLCYSKPLNRIVYFFKTIIILLKVKHYNFEIDHHSKMRILKCIFKLINYCAELFSRKNFIADACRVAVESRSVNA